MTVEIVTLVAVISAAAGASASTVQGYLATAKDKAYSVRKLFGALIGATFVSFGLINLVQLPEQVAAVGYVGLVVMNLILGYGIDKVITKAKA